MDQMFHIGLFGLLTRDALLLRQVDQGTVHIRHTRVCLLWLLYEDQSASVGPQWDMANIIFDWNKYRLEDPADVLDATFYWCEGRVESGGESDGESCPRIAGHPFAEF